jgi:hypothetical protein
MADDPRHGTNAGYSVGGCREQCCRRAHSNAMNLWRMGRADKFVPVIGTRRRIEALQALGWSRRELSRRLGHHQDYLTKAIGRSTVLEGTADKVRALYDELCMTPAPASNVSTRARANGHPPPLAWDDIDNPAEKQTCWQYAPASRTERFADLVEVGASLSDACRALDVSRVALEKWCARSGLAVDFRAMLARETADVGARNQWSA